jgi:hypothetical protein
VDNIRFIQAQLNIGLDSMVFLDDNPYERNLVKSQLPELTVPELPEDPSEYLSYVQGLNLFETVGVSENDVLRTQQIQDKIRIDTLKSSFATEGEFLASLHMVLQVSSFNALKNRSLFRRADRAVEPGSDVSGAGFFPAGRYRRSRTYCADCPPVEQLGDVYRKLVDELPRAQAGSGASLLELFGRAGSKAGTPDDHR